MNEWRRFGKKEKNSSFVFVSHMLKCLLDMQVKMSSSQTVVYIGLEFTEVVKVIEWVKLEKILRWIKLVQAQFELLEDTEE